MDVEEGSQLLVDTLEGDLSALITLSKHDHSMVQVYAARVGELILTAITVRKVLVALEQGEASPGLVQKWASFVRRDHFSVEDFPSIGSRSPGQPIQAIDIDYESSAEEQIVEVISRLDEIGDLIDGEITQHEIEAMLRELP